MTDHDYRLVRRLNDVEPKCGTCAWWKGEPSQAVAHCDRNTLATLNLSVCTAWKKRREADDVEVMWNDDAC